MFNQHNKTNPSSIVNFVPGFSFYEGIGDSLGEFLVDFFEAIASLIGRFRI